MTRLCSLLSLVLCMSFFICTSSAIGQESIIDVGGATIKGDVLEATPERRPIEGVTVKIVNSASEQEYTVTTDKDGHYEKTGLPAGRYMISVAKDGYGDRIGNIKVIAAGGEIYDQIKMRKKDNIFTFFQGQPFVWLLVGGVAVIIIVALVIFFIDYQKPRS